MKNQIKLTILAIALFSWACSNKNSVVINGQSTKNEIKFIEYAYPKNGVISPLMTDTIIPDSLGNFNLEIPIDKSSIIVFRPNFQKNPQFRFTKMMLTEPGESYKLKIDTTKEETNFMVEGKYAKASTEYNKLLGEKIHLISKRLTINFEEDSIASSFQNRINNAIENDLKIFRDFYNNGELSADLLKLIEADRYCMYSAITSIVLGAKFSSTKRAKSQGAIMTPEQRLKYLYKDEMYDVWKNSVLFPDSLVEVVPMVPWWFSMYNYYSMYSIDKNRNLSDEKKKELLENHLYTTNDLNNVATQVVPESLFESYFANNLFYNLFFMEEESYEMIALYNQFVADYPNSSYTRYLTPYIDKLNEYYKSIQDPGFSNDVVFVDNYRELTTLAECVAPFKGKKVYVDVWATWCGPCRAEFAKKDILQKILDEQDIEMLYISVDLGDNDEPWENYIKYYELSGHHIRANQQLYNDIRNIEYSGGEGSLYVPYHTMFDENGNQIDFPEEIKAYHELASN